MKHKNLGRIVYGPTPLQKAAVDNWLSGKYKYKYQALQDAGYNDKTAQTDAGGIFKSKGVQLYLKTLSKISKHRTGLSLPDKVALTYLDGLDATRLSGRDAIEHPDWMARKAFADKFAEFFGWSQLQFTPGSKFQQINFFSVPEEERHKFNESFKIFLRQLQRGGHNAQE